VAISISRAFKDISLSFVKNPITNDILALRNEDAIKKSVINLVRTQIGEIFFNRLIGTSIDKNLFELYELEISDTLSQEITILLENFEPRISVNNILVRPNEEDYSLNLEISYDIVGLPLPTQNIEFLLQSSRT